MDFVCPSVCIFKWLLCFWSFILCRVFLVHLLVLWRSLQFCLGHLKECCCMFVFVLQWDGFYVSICCLCVTFGEVGVGWWVGFLTFKRILCFRENVVFASILFFLCTGWLGTTPSIREQTRSCTRRSLISCRTGLNWSNWLQTWVFFVSWLMSCVFSVVKKNTFCFLCKYS